MLVQQLMDVLDSTGISLRPTMERDEQGHIHEPKNSTTQAIERLCMVDANVVFDLVIVMLTGPSSSTVGRQRVIRSLVYI